MNRKLAFGFIVLTLVAVVAASYYDGSRTTDAEDGDHAAILDLQTRVAVLETEVAGADTALGEESATYTINGWVGGTINENYPCSEGQPDVELGPGTKLTVKD